MIETDPEIVLLVVKESMAQFVEAHILTFV